jgi:hypothetical protein
MRDVELKIALPSITMAETPLVRGAFEAGGCRNADDIGVRGALEVARGTLFAVQVVGEHERF